MTNEKEKLEWREVRLSDLLREKPRYGITIKSKDKGKFLLLRITDIDDKGELKNKSDFKFVDIEDEIKDIYSIREGDLLLARSGSVGNFFIAEKNHSDWVFASYLIRFRLDKSKVYIKYLKYFLCSPYFRKWVKSMKRVGAQPNINAKEYSSFKVRIPFRNGKPDLETQKKIVGYIESNFSKIDKIIELKKEQLKELDEFWESVLDGVFKQKEGEEWRSFKFDELILREKHQVGKVNIREGLKHSGKIPVIDQGKEFIAGYLDNEEMKYKGPLPLIIFGDHTKTIKFIDFPFIVGADGVKILIPNKNLVYPKYFYWLLGSIKLPERGYARHFKFLKEAQYLIPLLDGKPDLKKQREISNYLDNIYEKTKNIKELIMEQISDLEELKEALFDKVFYMGEEHERKKGK